MLLEEFPCFHLEDDDDIDLPYYIAGRFVDYLLNAKNNGENEIYQKGLDFIEKLHLSEHHSVRVLATIGFLESFEFTDDEETFLNELGGESKKWRKELDLFWSVKIRYVGESFYRYNYKKEIQLLNL